MIWLLDSNLLIALATPDHTDHERSTNWFFSESTRRFATCPITQGALIRFQLQFGLGIKASDAWALVAEICALPNHEFWADDIDFRSVSHKGILGHRQVTDAYLVSLAAKHSGGVATMDEGLAALHPTRCLLVPR